jgi:hypothetical protein
MLVIWNKVALENLSVSQLPPKKSPLLLRNRMVRYRGPNPEQYLSVHSLPLQIHLDPLKTKLRLLYLKAQSVPRCKHFSSRL